MSSNITKIKNQSKIIKELFKSIIIDSRTMKFNSKISDKRMEIIKMLKYYANSCCDGAEYKNEILNLSIKYSDIIIADFFSTNLNRIDLLLENKNGELKALNDLCVTCFILALKFFGNLDTIQFSLHKMKLKIGKNLEALEISCLKKLNYKLDFYTVYDYIIIIGKSLKVKEIILEKLIDFLYNIIEDFRIPTFPTFLVAVSIYKFYEDILNIKLSNVYNKFLGDKRVKEILAILSEINKKENKSINHVKNKSLKEKYQTTSTNTGKYKAINYRKHLNVGSNSLYFSFKFNRQYLNNRVLLLRSFSRANHSYNQIDSCETNFETFHDDNFIPLIVSKNKNEASRTITKSVLKNQLGNFNKNDSYSISKTKMESINNKFLKKTSFIQFLKKKNHDKKSKPFPLTALPVFHESINNNLTENHFNKINVNNNLSYINANRTINQSINDKSNEFSNDKVNNDLRKKIQFKNINLHNYNTMIVENSNKYGNNLNKMIKKIYKKNTRDIIINNEINNEINNSNNTKIDANNNKINANTNTNNNNNNKEENKKL